MFDRSPGNGVVLRRHPLSPLFTDHFGAEKKGEFGKFQAFFESKKVGGGNQLSSIGAKMVPS